MIPFKKIAKIPAWKKFIAIGMISGLSGLTALYIPMIIDRELYKNLILSTIRDSVDYRIDVGPSTLSVFPFPELRLTGILIYKDKEISSPLLARIGETNIHFSWMSLIFRKVQISEIEGLHGVIEIEKDTQGKWNFYKNTESSDTKKSFTKFISIKSVSIENFNIRYTDALSKESKHLYIAKSKIKFPNYLQSLKFHFYGKLDNEKIQIHSDIRRENDLWDFASISGNAKIEVENFSLSIFKKYFSMFHNSNFTNSKLKGEFFISKKEGNSLNIKFNEAVFSNFGLIGQNYLPNLKISSDLNYIHQENRYIFHSLSADMHNIIRGNAKGQMVLGKNGNLYATIHSDFAEFDGVMKLIKVFSFKLPHSNPNSSFTANYSINATNVRMWGFHLNKCEMDMRSINKTYFVKRMNVKLFNGEVVGQGEMVFDHIPTYDFELVFSSIDAEKLIGHYTKEKYVTGQLEGIIKAYLVGKTTVELFRTLRATGNLTIYRGELLGYANVVKPIASIGKFINFLGPKGKSTEFQFLHAEYSINDEEIDFKKIKMKGVGMDIEGKGVIGFNKEIDMRFTAGLSGLVGKAIKVPVFYKGVMPKNWAFIDPIWLATVAGGAILSAPGTLIGSPVAGGIAGSAVYEYVRGFWDGVTGIFKKNKDK